MIHSVKLLVTIVIVMVSFISCTKKDSTDTETVLSDIDITSTVTSSSIELSWKPVEGCYWYRIYIAKSGGTLKEETNFQDLINNPITYTISGLTANTSYDIKMEGSDYATGGKLLASKTIKVSTIP